MGPLTGTRVLELPAIGPVPFVGMLLADLGAEVIRIDRPSGSDPLAEAMATSAMSRGRRSVRLDLRIDSAAQAVLRIADTCDALIEGFRPGVAERLGLGPGTVLNRNPRLVYGRMTGWGQDGPLAHTAGHDITYLAITGLLHGIGPADGPPTPPVNYLADFGGGAMVLAAGLIAALLHSHKTGQGQVIDAAMTEGASYLGTMTRTFLAAGDWLDRREANTLDGGAPNYRCYETADGKWLAIGAIEPKFWTQLLSALDLDLSEVPSPYERASWDACRRLLADIFVTRTRDEWAQRLGPLDACVAPVLTLGEAPHHPHNATRGSFVDIAGDPMPRAVPRFSATPPAIGPIPAIGEDTVAVLTEAGLTEAEIAEIRSGQQRHRAGPANA